MAVIQIDALANVSDSQSLFSFLHQQLEWPVDPEDSFTYPLVFGPDKVQVQAGQVPPFGHDDPFAIVLVEFGDKFKRTTLRATLRDIRRTMKEEGKLHDKSTEDLVFICAGSGYDEVRFAHFVEREGKLPKLSVFGWERRNADSTATVRRTNLECLRMPSEADPSEWRKQWLQAWDVEAVTKDFFREYKAVFEQVEGMVQGVKGDKRLFTQRLFNRLLFICFLEKKNWLQFPAADKKDGQFGYLHPLFSASTEKGENFYHDRLYWLFFHGLGGLPESQSVHSHPDLLERRGEVRYLNGGLFEMEPGDEQGAVTIPNEAFGLILNDLFLKFNFTITESMPDDVEVAVDPEMLGKVFEELVTGRHESGSYYTPRPIVSFMCKEALKGYLSNLAPDLLSVASGGSAGEGSQSSNIERLVDFHDAEGITVAEAKKLLKKLAAIKVVDPACGSGAYLLGMLQELYQLTILLDTTAEQATEREDYARKLQIIQNNLYGVDLDPFAVNVARLRLWLSLSVDANEPLPLPNLDFKIEAGDSLLAPLSGASAQTDTRGNLIERFRKAKADYADLVDGGDKRALKLEIQTLRKDIADWTHPGQTVYGFDWEVEFAEVFASKPPTTTSGGTLNMGHQLAEQPEQGGFDVVLANPPYVRQELISHLKPSLRQIFPVVYMGTADLYVYFYTRAIQLLNKGGMLVFISSNKWFKANYGQKLRQYAADVCGIISITDFGELRVFETAATFPMIFVAQKGIHHKQTHFTQVKSLAEPYPDIRQLMKLEGALLPDAAIAGVNWTLADSSTAAMLEKMEKAGVPLGEYVDGQIYRGVLTGFNRAFVIDGAKRAELIAEDPKSAEIIKPLAVGDDIRKWHIRERDRWLILTKIGTDMSRYPAVFAHLNQFKAHLEARWDKGEHWWELRACAYYDAFENPKIVFPDLAMEPRFAYDSYGAYTLNTTYVLPGAGHYLVGLLNSESIWTYSAATLAALGDAQGRGRLRFIAQFTTHLPVPVAPDGARLSIETLVQKCLDAKGENCQEWEREIDERVAALYGL